MWDRERVPKTLKIFGIILEIIILLTIGYVAGNIKPYNGMSRAGQPEIQGEENNSGNIRIASPSGPPSGGITEDKNAPDGEPGEPPGGDITEDENAPDSDNNIQNEALIDAIRELTKAKREETEAKRELTKALNRIAVALCIIAVALCIIVVAYLSDRFPKKTKSSLPSSSSHGNSNGQDHDKGNKTERHGRTSDVILSKRSDSPINGGKNESSQHESKSDDTHPEKQDQDSGKSGASIQDQLGNEPQEIKYEPPKPLKAVQSNFKSIALDEI